MKRRVLIKYSVPHFERYSKIRVLAAYILRDESPTERANQTSMTIGVILIALVSEEFVLTPVKSSRYAITHRYEVYERM